MSLESSQSSEAINWTLSKAELESLFVGQIEKIAETWHLSKKGDVLWEQQLLKGVICRISRSKYFDESLIINIIISNDQKVSSAQLELRRNGPFEWDIADRQVGDDKYKGKGILKAFVKAAERFVECVAARETEPHVQRVFLGTAQPNVFQIFEHLGYKVHEEDKDKARLLRNPANFPGEVVIQNAWMDARKSTERIELSYRDPYCFRHDALVDNPRPLPTDAVRVTLEKFINSGVATDQIRENIHTEAKELF